LISWSILASRLIYQITNHRGKQETPITDVPRTTSTLGR
jgi:hypothetical protein